mgnify:CR=1 FL=1
MVCWQTISIATSWIQLAFQCSSSRLKSKTDLFLDLVDALEREQK